MAPYLMPPFRLTPVALAARIHCRALREAALLRRLQGQ